MLTDSMAQSNDPKQFLADKEAYYEQVTRMVRWFGIAIVIATFSPSRPYYNLLLIAIAVAAAFNALRYSPLMRLKVFASRITTLVADNALIAILLALSGGVHSPYLLFWVFTIISSAYWYGQNGIIIVLCWEIAISLILVAWHGPAAEVDTVRMTIAEVFSLISLALLAERLTHVDRNERRVLAVASLQSEGEQQKLMALINSLVDPVIAIDEHAKISVYNGAALDLLNTNQQLNGQDLSTFLKLQDAKNQPISLGSLLGGESVLKRNDLLMQLSDGSTQNLDLSIAPIHADTTGSGYILILRDITKQRSLDQERDEFLAVTSHELRTPIAIAEANLSTALMPKFDSMGSKARELVQQAHQNIIFLGQLIADLSTLSKAEQGRLKIEVETIEPGRLVHQLAEDYHASAQAKNLELKVNVDPDAVPFLSSLSLLHEILQNFITNAIKYTEKGSVTLSAAPGTHGRSVVFSVSDTGIGISVSDQKKLFTKFYRSEDYRTRKTNGTGLGLYITLKLASRLGTKVTYKSRLNTGSTFMIEVPDQPHHAGPAPAIKEALKHFVER